MSFSRNGKHVKSNPDKINFFPVGYVLVTVTNSDPSLEWGVWTSLGSGKTLVGVDPNDADYNTVEKTGGSKTRSLISDNIPSHNHTASSNSSSSSTTTTSVSVKSTFSGTSGWAQFGTRCDSKYGGYNRIQGANASAGDTGITVSNPGNVSTRMAADFSGETSAQGICRINITPKGTISNTVTPSSSTTTTTTTTTTIENTGSGTGFDIKNPYITVYFWKRIN